MTYPQNPPPSPFQTTPTAPPPQQPRQATPVTFIIIGITVLVFIAQFLVEQAEGVDMVLYWGAKINELIIAGEYWRLITPILLHASISHILFNMYALASFGPALERFYGWRSFLLLYLVGGLSGNVLSFLFSANPAVGASSSIFGLVAAEGIFIFRNRAYLGSKAGSMLSNTLFIVAINLFFGFTSKGIDNFGHLGGLAGGLVFAWLAGPVLGVEQHSWGYKLVNTVEEKRAWLVALVLAAFFIFLALLGIEQGIIPL